MIDNEYPLNVQTICFEILEEFNRICVKHNLHYYLDFGTLLGAIRHKGFIPWDDDLDVAMLRDDYDKFINIVEDELDDRFFFDYMKTDTVYFEGFAKIRRNNTTFLKYDHALREYPNLGIWIDIFPIDYCPEDNTKDFVKWKYSLNHNRNLICSKTAKWKSLKSIKSVIKKSALLLIPLKLLLYYRNKLERKYYKKTLFLNSSHQPEMVSYNYDWFSSCKMVDFCGKDFPVPVGYKEILTKLYGNYMNLPPLEERKTHQPERIEIDI